MSATETDLMTFCADSKGSLYDCTKTLVYGSWKYYTDRRVLVRVPTEEPQSPPQTPLRFPDVATLPWHGFRSFKPVEVILPEGTPCGRCGGEKTVQEKECPDCEGFGCDNCSGEGYVTDPNVSPRRCWDCYGSGLSFRRIVVGDYDFSLQFLSMISKLPSFECMPFKLAGNGILLFRFDNGEGMLAGLNPE